MFNNKICFLLAATLFLTNIALAQSWKNEKYDSRWLPITDNEITKEVKDNSHDAVALYRLWWRAIYQKQQEPFFSALRSLKVAEPNNGTVLATYCAVLTDSLRYGGTGKYQYIRTLEERDSDFIWRELERAQKLEPKLWLVLTTKAELTLITKEPPPAVAKEVVALCREAVVLEPELSYVHQRLGYALTNLAMVNGASYSEAEKEYEMATRLFPVDSGVGFLWRNLCRAQKKSDSSAIKFVIGTIPSNIKLAPHLIKLLVNQGITIPG